MSQTEVRYVAVTGSAAISTANSNLNGTTGDYGTVLTGDGGYGILIKNITVKATGNTSRGMVRLFVGTSLVKEIEVPFTILASSPPPITNGRDPAFSVSLEVNLFLADGVALKASTQNAEEFLVIAEGLYVSYYIPS